MLTEAQVHKIIGRERPLFTPDLERHRDEIRDALVGANVLVIGAAGSIGSATTKILAEFSPKSLHLVDINENELADLVRQLRISSLLNDQTELRTFVIDVNSQAFSKFCRDGRHYDFVFNLSAMKHVRSESNVYSLTRLIETNVIATNKIIEILSEKSKFKYFCVSTDKAANPVNLMGLSKLVMENYAFSNSCDIPVSSARFANVAFSNGSLLQSFERRFDESQPIVIPSNISRYFITEHEAGVICVLSGVLVSHRNILVPSESAGLSLTSFETIVRSYLEVKGFLPKFVDQSTEHPAPSFNSNHWPVIQSKVDTTGEKTFEEFVGENEEIITSPFGDLSIIGKSSSPPELSLSEFQNRFFAICDTHNPNKSEYVQLLLSTGAGMDYDDVGKYLDDKL